MWRVKSTIGKFPFHGLIVRLKLSNACKLLSIVPGMK